MASFREDTAVRDSLTCQVEASYQEDRLVGSPAWEAFQAAAYHSQADPEDEGSREACLVGSLVAADASVEAYRAEDILAIVCA